MHVGESTDSRWAILLLLQAGVAILVALARCYAGEFKNLGFDDVNPTGSSIGYRDGGDKPVPYGQGDVEDLLPGWELRLGTNNQRSVWLNMGWFDGDVPVAELAGNGTAGTFAEVVLSTGRFALGLLRVSPEAWTVTQSGVVPPHAHYLSYRYIGDEPEVQINGRSIVPLNRQTNSWWPGHTLVATNLVYDVSQFAGTEVTLTLAGPPLGPPDLFTGRSAASECVIDNIQFVTEAPTLHLSRRGDQLTVSWPASATGFGLETASLVGAPMNWKPVPIPPEVSAQEQSVTIQLDVGSRLYRLGLTQPW